MDFSLPKVNSKKFPIVLHVVAHQQRICIPSMVNSEDVNHLGELSVGQNLSKTALFSYQLSSQLLKTRNLGNVQVLNI